VVGFNSTGCEKSEVDESIKTVSRSRFWVKGLAQRHLVALLLGLVAVVISVSVGQVWAYTISPNPPVAEQPFTITASNSNDYIIVGGFCLNGAVTGFMTASQGSVTLTLSAGQYSFEIPSEVSCTLFTVVPASIPEYPYGLALLAVFMVLGYAVVKRRMTTR